jgi:hypothetical protein
MGFKMMSYERIINGIIDLNGGFRTQKYKDSMQITARDMTFKKNYRN